MLGVMLAALQARHRHPLAGDGGGAPESVLDGRTGDVVDGTDTDAVADDVARLLADPERAQRYAAEGRRYVEEAWNWHILGEQLSAVLDGDGRRPPRHSWNWRG